MTMEIHLISERLSFPPSKKDSEGRAPVFISKRQTVSKVAVGITLRSGPDVSVGANDSR